jgi:hypothetical protein
MTDIERTDPEADRTLRRGRPKPDGQFDAGLRERLLAQHAAARRPPRLWLLVGVYVLSGLILLILAALSASGGGPFGS